MKRPPGYEKLKRAQGLRQEMTPQEQVLWRNLRGRRLAGVKFRRQMWLAGYIADFASPEAKLVVEADGSQHADTRGYDEARADAFARIGWRTLRFWNNEITKNLEGVLAAIQAALRSPSHPASPSPTTPLPVGEREGSAAKRWEGEDQPDYGQCPSPGRPSADHPLPRWERDL